MCKDIIVICPCSKVSCVGPYSFPFIEAVKYRIVFSMYLFTVL